MLNCKVVGVMADEQQLSDAIKRYYGKSDSIDDLLQ